MVEVVVEVVVNMVEAGQGEGLTHREMDLIKSVSPAASTASDQQLKLMSEIAQELPPTIPKEKIVDIVAAASGTGQGTNAITSLFQTATNFDTLETRWKVKNQIDLS